jgi:hypothetical protein
MSVLTMACAILILFTMDASSLIAFLAVKIAE